ncbi:MAG: hypothetical protein NVS3B21_31060 [Acidimicrobiales bacterium]
MTLPFIVPTATVLSTAGNSLRTGFFMFWETLWALVLGFGLSGAVQAFVSRDEMQRTLGDHRPLTVAKASGFGMISSSCSYAASAMAKSLFQKGADFLSSMAFMFASTNLVIELGIVLYVLLGWQYTLAEFIGGPIMIALLVLVGSVVLTKKMTDGARDRLRAGTAGAGGHDHAAMVDAEGDGALQAQPWSVKLRSKAGWADAASYTMADITMLRKELVIGYVIAGFLDVAVSRKIYEAVFFTGHGFWTTLENVIVGPVIAFISFVCSVGNVPMALGLVHGGISFGGVISFLFADLIAFPLVMIYRKFYGTKLAIRLTLVFWAVMAAAGLLVELLFKGVGAVPSTQMSAMKTITTHFTWNYTSILNIIFSGIFAVLYLLYRNRHRLGGGHGYAIDPVCGMQVQTSNAPASIVHEGHPVYFCSNRCEDKFVANPAKFDGPGAKPEGMGTSAPAPADSETAHRLQADVDPVCGMTVDPQTAPAHRRYAGRSVSFCNPGCAITFDADPVRYAGAAADTDPVCGMTVDTGTAAAHRTHDDAEVFFCGTGCAERFDADPAGYTVSADRPA